MCLICHTRAQCGVSVCTQAHMSTILKTRLRPSPVNNIYEYVSSFRYLITFTLVDIIAHYIGLCVKFRHRCIGATKTLIPTTPPYTKTYVMNLLLHINHGTSAAQSHRQRRIDERVRVLAVLTYNNLFNSRVRGQYRCCLSNGPAGRVHHAQPRPLMPACDAIMGCDSNVNAVDMVGHGREETNYFMLRCLLTCHALRA